MQVHDLGSFRLNTFHPGPGCTHITRRIVVWLTRLPRSSGWPLVFGLHKVIQSVSVLHCFGVASQLSWCVLCSAGGPPCAIINWAYKAQSKTDCPVQGVTMQWPLLRPKYNMSVQYVLQNCTAVQLRLQSHGWYHEVSNPQALFTSNNYLA